MSTMEELTARILPRYSPTSVLHPPALVTSSSSWFVLTLTCTYELSTEYSIDIEVHAAEGFRSVLQPLLPMLRHLRQEQVQSKCAESDSRPQHFLHVEGRQLRPGRHGRRRVGATDWHEGCHDRESESQKPQQHFLLCRLQQVRDSKACGRRWKHHKR